MARIKYYPSSKRIKLPFNGNNFYTWLNDGEKFSSGNIKEINRNPKVSLFQSVTFTKNGLKDLFSDIKTNDILVFLPTIIGEADNRQTTLAVFETSNDTGWQVGVGKDILVSSNLKFNNSDFELKYEQIAKLSKPVDDRFLYEWSIPKFEGTKKLKDIIYNKSNDSEKNLSKNRCVTGIFNKSDLEKIITGDCKFVSFHPVKAICTTKDTYEKTSRTEEDLTFLAVPLDREGKPILLQKEGENLTKEDTKKKHVFYLESMWNPYWKKWTKHNREVFEV